MKNKKSLIKTCVLGFLLFTGCETPEQIENKRVQRQSELDSILNKKIIRVQDGTHLFVLTLEDETEIQIVSHKRYFDANILMPSERVDK